MRASNNNNNSSKNEDEHFSNIIKHSSDMRSNLFKVKDINALNKTSKSNLFLTNPLLKKTSFDLNTKMNLSKKNLSNVINNNNITNVSDSKEIKEISRNNFNKTGDESSIDVANINRRNESMFARSSININDSFLSLQDKIFNIMHFHQGGALKQKNISNNDVLENNKKIKYVMYKGGEKSLEKTDLLYEDYLKGPNAFRSNSIFGILQRDKDYLKFKDDIMKTKL